MTILAEKEHKGNVTVLRSHNCDCSMGHTVTDQVNFVTRRRVTIVTNPGKVTLFHVGELHLIESRRGHKNRFEIKPAYFGGLFSFVPLSVIRKG